ncbi:hypothetical protein [Tardiphaga sp. 803_E3_N1_3]|uniref:hypothetical protein n=1 Tax=Tardiphaga sp. 803_E3_N1_3 TaxID=3240785 RepID=UPI003F26725B
MLLSTAIILDRTPRSCPTFAGRSRAPELARSNSAASNSEGYAMTTNHAPTTRTHCINGHPWITGNIRLIKGRDTTVCIPCTRESAKRFRVSNNISRVRTAEQKAREYAKRNKHGLLLKQGQRHIDQRSPTLAEWQAGIKRVCLKGHPLDSEADFRFQKQCATVICKRCCAIKAKKCKIDANFSEETIRRIIALIDLGATKHNLTGRMGTGGKASFKGVVDITRFNNWLKRNPKLNKVLEKKLEENRNANRIAGAAKKKTNRLKISQNSNVFDVIEDALTMWLDPETERKDIITNIYLAVADGKLKVKDIKAKAKGFVAAHRRQYSNTGRYGSASLDAPAYRDSTTSIGDTITHGLWQ